MSAVLVVCSTLHAQLLLNEDSKEYGWCKMLQPWILLWVLTPLRKMPRYFGWTRYGCTIYGWGGNSISCCNIKLAKLDDRHKRLHMALSLTGLTLCS